MTNREVKLNGSELKALLLSDEDGFPRVLRTVVQEVLEAEIKEALGPEKGDRTAERIGYRSGYYERNLVTRLACWSCGFRRIGSGGSRRNCSSATSARGRRCYRRWWKCTWKGYRRAGSRRLPKSCAATASRPRRRARRRRSWIRRCRRSSRGGLPNLTPPSLAACYERVREAGVIASQAVLMAIGVDWRAGVRCSGSNWPTEKAARAGASS